LVEVAGRSVDDGRVEVVVGRSDWHVGGVVAVDLDDWGGEPSRLSSPLNSRILLGQGPST
jgi:hypothetical protein